jgi:hypothetical protein
MHTATTSIEISQGKVTPETRPDLAGLITSLPDGWHKIVSEQVRRGYTSTRYKYYFGHVLQSILLTAGHHFKVLEGDQWRPARDTNELHEFFKLRFNPAFIQGPSGMFISSNTTTSLSDRQFIAQFEEAIIIEFSEPPYGVEFMPREEYALLMKAKKVRQ